MENETKDTCMACTCPCEEHKEHNHEVEDQTKVCEKCSHEHKVEGGCDCGCV